MIAKMDVMIAAGARSQVTNQHNADVAARHPARYRRGGHLAVLLRPGGNPPGLAR